LGIVRGGAPGLDGSKPFASFKVKVYSWALFILVPFSLPLYVCTCSFCLDKFRRESGVDLLCFRRERGKLVVKMDLYILSFCISIFCGKTLCGDSFGV
jgi:hypothetical protein